MRSSLTWLASLAFVVACADVPTAPPMHQPQVASFDEEDDPPPPWQRVEGTMVTETGTVSYEANFLATPGNNNVAWLHFIGDAFTADAKIMSVKGVTTGTGSFTVGDETYQLNTVTEISFNEDCTNALSKRTTQCVEPFSGDGFASTGATWSGFGPGGTRGLKPGKPGDDWGECTIACFDSGISGSKGR